MDNPRALSRLALAMATLLATAAVVRGQPPPGDPVAQPVHQHERASSLFSARETSGTAWMPDATPMLGVHAAARGWELMLHGNVSLQFLHENAPEHRGATQGSLGNWMMAGARRRMGAGHMGARVMLSLEPWTIAGCGYPNLLATGEFCDGDNIHDRQHPHGLFMELAVELDRPLAGAVRWQAYGGLAGEPALGPPSFPHRLSALSNPLSPIAHHWLDSTHIAHGVVTGGVYGGRWKTEVSLFNGREPDERRHDLDGGALDSISGRLWFVPTASLALQVSAGRLTDAERLQPGEPAMDIARLTASATYHRRSAGQVWATTFAWGANREDGDTTHALLAESSVGVLQGHTWFGRAELNGKSAHDLHVHESDATFTVGKLQAGYVRHLRARRGWTPGIGAIVSAAFVPPALRPRYGGVGVGLGAFLTLRPAAAAIEG